ncbi:sensor histidine kinase [Deinococcus yavapaiensis]|uniref:histidine kinase n=1 Tax=Deinococcus yavapaiensis KR-236 TaxID=694435 RepID=A0A318S6H3_9DEIO|nr:HAMP domain-containing sensor histidine kinase [Deinococcus yavapaiensis]PYE53249.1 signal transduction histidine kinase [Deinococcus yavapaiensis KR-236]
MNIRLRLALLASVVSAAMMLAMFLALYFSVRGTLVGVLDASLRTGVAARVAEDVRRSQYPQPYEGFRRNFDSDRNDNRPRVSRPTPPGLATVVTFGKDGAVASGTPPLTLPLIEGFVRVNGYRILTARLPSGGWVRAFRAEDELLSSLEGVTHVFSVVAPLVILLGFLGGYLLAGRALRPVGQVTRLAARIAASGRYRERVPHSPGRDEMARLTETINAMLDRLADLIEHERAFALAAAHELRTPLAVIRARASLALERERSPLQYQAALAEIEGVSTDLSRLADRLLALARTSVDANREDLDLADLALEASEVHSSALRERRLTLTLDLTSAPAAGDRTVLLLAASNLVQNAARYVREGGAVRVRAGAQGDESVLVVEDDGPGIPDEDAERLQKPFQRGLGLQGSEGAGLGLALVSGISRQHGGTFSLGRSDLGGLKAEIRLPARPTPPTSEHGALAQVDSPTP